MTIQHVKIEFQLRLHNFYDTKEIQSIFEILADDIGISKTDILFNASRVLQAEEQRFFASKLQRLENNEPVQYIRGKADFYGLEFHVTPQVLIPRQETEILVHTILKEFPTNAKSLLDIGTGSGCIAISIAKRKPHIQVYAADISKQALEVTQKNALLHGVQLNCLQTDMCNQTMYSNLPNVDILVSNPPYVCYSEKQYMKANVLEHEPHLALFVEDTSPLHYYEALANIGIHILPAGGKIYCEINEAFGKQTQELFETYGYSQVQILKDLHDKDRFVKAEKTA